MVSKNNTLTRRQLLCLLGTGAAAGFTTSFLSGCAVDPVTGKKQLMMMSEQNEISLDKKQSPYQFSTDYGVTRDTGLNQYINKVGLDLAARSDRPHMPFSFRAVNASYINAYAFPGGSIAVTRGILVELKNEAELAALLGHEIGHVCARHTAEQSTKGMLTSVLLGGAAIATSAAGYEGAASLVQEFGQLGAGALLAKYSRDNEREADALGMEYMTRSGYNPAGMTGLIKVLLENGKRNPSAIELMFSTHPMSTERYKNAQQLTATKYHNKVSAPFHRERFMDMTASLRKQKTGINTIQQGSKLMGQKKYNEAEKTLKTALKTMNRDYTAHVLMAKCQFAKENINQATKYAQKATQLYPQEAQAHILLGMCGVASKKYAMAFEHLSTFDRILPGNPEVTFFQGVSQEGMNRKQEAAKYYHTYLQKVPHGKKAEYAYNKLKTWGYTR